MSKNDNTVYLRIIEEFINYILKVVENENYTREISPEFIAFLNDNNKFFADIDPWSNENNSYDIVELYIKEKCVTKIRKSIINGDNPLQYFSSNGLDKYCNILSNYAQENSFQFPELFCKIVKLISLHYANFENVTLYNRHLIDNYSNTVFMIQELSTQAQTASDKIDDNNNSINTIQTDLETVKSDLETAKGDVSEVKEEISGSLIRTIEIVITVLGIFASIILTYHGVLTFSSSVLAAVTSANTYRVILLTLLVGLIGISLTFGLLFFLNTIRSKEKSTHIFVTFIISIIIVLILIGVTIYSWENGLIEERDKKINQHQVNTEQNISKIATSEQVPSNVEAPKE